MRTEVPCENHDGVSVILKVKILRDAPAPARIALYADVAQLVEQLIRNTYQGAARKRKS